MADQKVSFQSQQEGLRRSIKSAKSAVPRTCRESAPAAISPQNGGFGPSLSDTVSTSGSFTRQTSQAGLILFSPETGLPSFLTAVSGMVVPNADACQNRTANIGPPNLRLTGGGTGLSTGGCARMAGTLSASGNARFNQSRAKALLIKSAGL